MDRFIVINKSVINVDRVLAIHHIPRDDTGGAFIISEQYRVVFDTGQDLTLKPIDGQPLIERFRNLSKPSCGVTQTTSEDAT